MKEIRDEIVGVLCERGFVIEAVDCEKNGILMHGIADRSNGDVCPVVYVENLKRQYGDLPAEGFADIVARFFGSDEARMPDGLIGQFLDRKNILENIYPELTGNPAHDAVRRKSPLGKLEQQLVVSLASGKGFMSMKVSAPFLKMAGITEDEAWEVAQKNNEKNACVMDILGVIQEMRNVSPATPRMDDLPLYVVTNTNRMRGAACLFTKKAVTLLKQMLGTDRFIILPSSIHEVLVMDRNLCDNPASLAEIVTSINQSDVEPEERLSDTVYTVTAEELLA